MQIVLTRSMSQMWWFTAKAGSSDLPSLAVCVCKQMKYVLAFAILLLAPQLHGRADQKRKEKVMFHIDEIVTLLQRERVKAEDVAMLYPEKGDRTGDGYNIYPAGSPVHEVIIGLERGRHTLSLPPEYVQLRFQGSSSVTLDEAVPFCSTWQPTAGTVQDPSMYICRMPKHGPVSVVLFASLSDTIDHPKVKVFNLTIRRDS